MSRINNSAEAASRVPSPRSESDMAVKSPATTPATRGKTDLLPWARAWLTTRMIVGPGIMRIRLEARIKPIYNSILIARLLPPCPQLPPLAAVQPGRLGKSYLILVRTPLSIMGCTTIDRFRPDDFWAGPLVFSPALNLAVHWERHRLQLPGSVGRRNRLHPHLNAQKSCIHL